MEKFQLELAQADLINGEEEKSNNYSIITTNRHSTPVYQMLERIENKVL